MQSSRKDGATREDHEEALLDMLAASPNVLLTVLLLVGFGVYMGEGRVHPAFLWPWAVVTLAVGVTRQGLIWVFRVQRARHRESNRRRWLQVARWAPPSYGVLYAAYVLVAFPDIGLSGRLIVSLIGAGMLMGAIGFSALAGPSMLYLLLVSSAAAWLMSGGELAIPTAIVCAVGMLMYPPARRRQAALDVERVRLVHQASDLSAELAARNAALERIHQERTLMLATTSHDLRQPIQALELLVENLAAEPAGEAERHRWRLIRSSVGMVGDMLSSLMDVSRLDSGQYAVHRIRFSLERFLREAVETHEERASQRGLALHLRSEAIAGIALDTDRGLLGRIVSNLLDNAIKYTDEGQVQVIAGVAEDGSVRISVVDTGIGMDVPAQQQIFDAYVRLDHAGRRAGLGVGLAVVSLGARLLGLGIEVDSAQGRGSRFTLTVPAAQVVRTSGGWPAETMPAALAPLGERTAPRRIALVDDDRVIVEALAGLLRAKGYEVLADSSAPRLLERLVQEAFDVDLIVSDLRLDPSGQGSGGLELIQAIRAHLGGRVRPAILLTGDVRVHGTTGHEPLRVLHKPVRAQALLGTVAELLEPQPD